MAVRSKDDPEPLIAVGRVVGEITEKPIGINGFGFDPVMFLPKIGKTFAQLSDVEKNAMSHRGQAAKQMVATDARKMVLSKIIPVVPVSSATAAPQSSKDPGDLKSPKDITHYMRAGLLQLAALPPLSLYIHLPWCLKKCPYCDFNSHEVQAGGALSAELEERYINAVVADLDASLPLIWGRPVHSIFIGGGTPSLFSPASIDRLLGDIRARVKLDPDCEITLEANPGTFEKDRFKAFRAAGVTRLSIGVQSFNDAHLKALGRVHDSAQAFAAVEEAAQAFDTFNLDLMYALPGQTIADLERDVQTALSLTPPHISIYHLTIEPNTYFAKFPPVVPEEDTAYAMLDKLTELLGGAGLERYEVSAYAKPGHRCWHNLNYWQFGDYLGLGAGAHSKLSFAHRVVRQVRLPRT